MVSLIKIPATVRDEIWRDAWRIAWIGASNPAGAARILALHTADLLHIIGTRPAERYPALQAIAGHLAFLFGHGLGPTDQQLDLVKVNAQRLGLDVRL